MESTSTLPKPFPYIVDLSFVRESIDLLVFVDVRWYLDGRSGHAAYLAGHLPGAIFLDIDRDLSGAPGPSGRHPLPNLDTICTTLQQQGIGPDDVVIAYDDCGGLSAARLVFLLRALGIRSAVLDGGIAAYDGPLETKPAHRPPSLLKNRAWSEDMTVTLEAVTQRLAQGSILLDVRAEERYLGKSEPIDPVAGHIPGARNLPTTRLLGEDRRFLSAHVLRETFSSMAIKLDDEVVVYCGSGVTACHTWLALRHIGHARVLLYPGSWSEWCRTPGCAIATGNAPEDSRALVPPTES